MPGELVKGGLAILYEGVAALHRFVRSVPPTSLLLPRTPLVKQIIVDHIESILEHLLCCGALRVDLFNPILMLPPPVRRVGLPCCPSGLTPT